MTRPSVTRRGLIRAGLAGGLTDFAGVQSMALGRGSRGLSAQDSTTDSDTTQRVPGWTSMCDTYWKRRHENKPKVFRTGSRLEYLGTSWHDYGNPSVDPTHSGAWRHTFLLSSVAVRLNSNEGGGYSIVNDGQISNNFAVASGNARLESLLDGTAKRNTGTVLGQIDGDKKKIPTRDTLQHLEWSDEKVQGYDTSGRNIALAPYHDANLYGFVDPEALQESIETSGGYLDLNHLLATPPSEAVVPNTTAKVIRQRERGETQSAVAGFYGLAGIAFAIGGVVITSAALLTSTVSVVTGGTLGLSIGSLVGSITDATASGLPGGALDDGDRLPGEVSESKGFGRQRGSGAAGVEAHFALFDAIVPPNGQEAFYVKPKHRTLGKNDTAFDFDNIVRVDDEERGYDKATVQPTWLIGVTGAEPNGDPENATARILGTNFENWTDDPANGRYWAQSPRPSVSGPGMWTAAAFEETVDRKGIDRALEDLTPPPATPRDVGYVRSDDSGTGTFRFDASGTVLGGAHIGTYEWGFSRISRDALQAAHGTPFNVDTVALAMLYDEIEQVDTLGSRTELKQRIDDSGIVDIGPDLGTEALPVGFGRTVLRAIDHDISKNTGDNPTVDVALGSGLWGVKLTVEEETDDPNRGTTTGLINIGRDASQPKSPVLGRIDTPGAPLELDTPEPFVVTEVETRIDGVSASDLEYDWVVSPVDVPTARETGGQPIDELATVVTTSQGGRRADIEFTAEGEYSVRVVATYPDDVSRGSETTPAVQARSVFLLGSAPSRVQPSVIDSFEDRDLSEYEVRETQEAGQMYETTNARSSHGDVCLTPVVPTNRVDGVPRLTHSSQTIERGNTYEVDYYLDTANGRNKRYHDPQLWFAVQDTDNYYKCTINNGGRDFKLGRVKGGSTETLASKSGGRTNEWDTLKVDFRDDGTIVCSVSDATISAIDDEFDTGGYGFAIGGRATDNYWDNLRRVDNGSSDRKIVITSDIHHLGDGEFSGQPNSTFQEPAEGRSFTTTFELAEWQANRDDGVLTLSVRGSQGGDNPVSINGTVVGEIPPSPADGSATSVTLPVDQSMLEAGENEFRAASTVPPGYDDNLDDFELWNVRLWFDGSE